MNTTEQEKNQIIELLKKELPVLRIKAHISQEELAGKIGISRQTYCAIENDRREMSWTTFMALIAYFQNNEDTREYLNDTINMSNIISAIL